MLLRIKIMHRVILGETGKLRKEQKVKTGKGK